MFTQFDQTSFQHGYCHVFYQYWLTKSDGKPRIMSRCVDKYIHREHFYKDMLLLLVTTVCVVAKGSKYVRKGTVCDLVFTRVCQFIYTQLFHSSHTHVQDQFQIDSFCVVLITNLRFSLVLKHQFVFSPPWGSTDNVTARTTKRCGYRCCRLVIMIK